MKPKCENCFDTGYYGDNGPMIRGNREFLPCECKRAGKVAEMNFNERMQKVKEWAKLETSGNCTEICEHCGNIQFLVSNFELAIDALLLIAAGIGLGAQQHAENTLKAMNKEVE